MASRRGNRRSTRPTSKSKIESKTESEIKTATESENDTDYDYETMVVELTRASRLRRKFFARYRKLERWFSSPVILVEDTTVPQLHTALNTVSHSVFADPPPPTGATFSLNCIHIGDVLQQFSKRDHYALTQILGVWHSGDYKRTLMRKLIIDFLVKDGAMLIDTIYATYFGGDEKTDPDEEWKTILLEFLPSSNVMSSNVLKSVKKESFWNVDGTGPCGPCSTIYFCMQVTGSEHIPPRARINQKHKTMPQICNLVFVKFNRETDGVLSKLPVEHVIAGINFEAATPPLQGHLGPYASDMFTPVLDIIYSFTGKGIEMYPSYLDLDACRGADVAAGIGRAYRIIADHLRVISVSTADGAQVGENGRETLLRLIDRHAIQLGVELLKIKEYPRLVKEAIAAMAELIPELLPTIDNLKEERLKKIFDAEVRIYRKILAEIARQKVPQQGDAASSSCTTWYKTRAIKFLDHSTHIIHKDKDEQSFLVALCNVLLLEGKLSLGSDITELSLGHLICLVQKTLLCDNRNMLLQNKLERSHLQKSVLDVLSCLPSDLPTNVEHDSVSGFVNTPQTTLFKYLGVPLYHGSIMDQEDEMLTQRASKLTPRGFTQLQIELKEKEPSLLFWNGSFLTTVKVEGVIYLLLDDTRFANEQTHMFWECLKEAKIGGLFTDSQFLPVDSDLSFSILPLTKSERSYLKKKNKKKAEAVNGKHLEELTCQTNIPDEDIYPTRLINFSDRQFNIILQDKNGPCSLIAICNVLILKGEIILETKVTEVHKDYLIKHLELYLKQRKGCIQYSEIPAEVLDVLPTLAFFVTVNMKFDRTDSFEETPPIALFRHLGIPLYHGWLPDPSDVTMTSTVLLHSYDTLLKAVLDPNFPNVDHAKLFLEGQQPTNHGLHCLRNDLKEEVPCVLFSNKHCSTVLKIKGELYSLATDSSFSGESVVWERLLEGGSTELMDSNFIPTAGAPQSQITQLDDQLAWQTVLSRRVALRTVERLEVNVVIKDGVQTEIARTLEEFSSTGVNYFAEMKMLFEYGTQVTVADTILFGRIIASDLLHQLVGFHDAECSFNGNFDRRRIIVSGGLHTMLRAMIKEEFGEFSRGAMHNDYTTFNREVLSLFEVKGVGYPAFFNSLIMTLKNTNLQALSPSDLKIFFKKVLGNLALMPPLARAEFFCSVHRIRRNAPHLRSDLRIVLQQRLTEDEDWRFSVLRSKHPLLLKTLRYKNKDSTDVYDQTFGHYKNTLDSLTQFPHQVFEHAGDDPQDKSPYHEPYKNESELDLLYSAYIDAELSWAYDELLTSVKLTQRLHDRLREVFESLDRQEVFPQNVPRGPFSA